MLLSEHSVDIFLNTFFVYFALPQQKTCGAASVGNFQHKLPISFCATAVSSDLYKHCSLLRVARKTSTMSTTLSVICLFICI